MRDRIAATKAVSRDTAAPRATHGGKVLKRASNKKLFFLYTGAFVLVLSLVTIGYQSDPQTHQVANVQSVADETAADVEVSRQVATGVGANFAAQTNMPVAANVANMSISLEAKREIAQTDEAVIAKPQIVQPTTKSRTITTHIAKKGDNVKKIAKQYNIKPATVQWANNLASNDVKPGEKLTIPPVDGVVYTVKKGDTPKSIAKAYKANADRIVAFNDLEVSGLKKDRKIVIPEGILPTNERPGYVEPNPFLATTQNPTAGTDSNSNTNNSTYTPPASNFASGSVGNRYAAGYCTWYAYERRAASGKPVGSFWGDATSWASAARSQGFVVNDEPAAGAVFQTSYGGGGYGHVGIIDSVDHKRGTVTYSDMNGVAGFGAVGSQTIPISQAKAQWDFIH